MNREFTDIRYFIYSIKFICKDKPNERTVTLKTTLQGENISHYIDAFRAFLLAMEFHPDVVKRALGEDK